MQSTTHIVTGTNSWGRYPKSLPRKVISPSGSSEPLPFHQPDAPFLPFGLGRSYGDSCLNNHGSLILSTTWDHFLDFNPETGVLRCESGVSFADVLETFGPQGWFVPVTPGTKYVTVGGAIANDVHGKNHHGSGNFGNHVLRFELLRSDGTRLVCSESQNHEWFAATIGGLGLTGMITWAEFRLIPIHNPFIEQEVIRFENVSEFFQLCKASENKFPYTVAWVDCLAPEKNLGRGHFIRGNHAQSGTTGTRPSGLKKTVPLDFPNGVLNPLTVSAFNKCYYWRKPWRMSREIVHYDPFFYPLDAILHWNRIYGKSGFMQYQFVVPNDANGQGAFCDVLQTIRQSGHGSFLAVMKTFGDIPAKGLMSFPRPGLTLALDFPRSAHGLFEMLDRLDAIVMKAHGAIYPAKDARMSPEVFLASFPQMHEFQKYIDPMFSSSFWRRVTSG